MYDAVEEARDAGTNLAFFGANDVYWQVRFEPSASGVDNRVMVCYKDATADPITINNLKTVKWRDAVVNRPEQGLIGVQYTALLSSDNYQSYVVKNSDHWVYAGTGFVDGSSVPGMVGYETDRVVDGVPLPAHQSFMVVSHSPVVRQNGSADYANSVIYQVPGGAWVFGAGTIAWS